MSTADGHHVPIDPTEAKDRLQNTGVDFKIPDGHAEIQGDAGTVLVYYVVTLVFERKQARQDAVYASSA